MKLVAGPWCGEFGWEIARWVPHVRHKSMFGGYDEVEVICQTRHEYLYADFCDNFKNCDIDGERSEFMINGIVPSISESTLLPGPAIRHSSKMFHRPYRNVQNDFPKIDVLIHARAVTTYNTGYRNWPAANWQALIGAFPKFKFASIGTIAGAWHIDGTLDLRGLSIEYLIAYICNARCVVGPSSGPIHLASYCLTPHIVWTDNKRQRAVDGGTNRDRYKYHWNPFDTYVDVIDCSGWQPRPDRVISALGAFLAAKCPRNSIVRTRSAPAKPDRRDAPYMAMVTYERGADFNATVSSLKSSSIKLDNLYIFDDCSQDRKKQYYIRMLQSKYKIYVNNQRLGVVSNSIHAIDVVANFCTKKWFFYLQDDIEFPADWYYYVQDVVNELYRDGVQWGMLGLVHYDKSIKTDKSYIVMDDGHLGGAAWVINKECWLNYRSDNPILHNPHKTSAERRGEKLWDFKFTHWCHFNDINKYAVCYTTKSYVKHVGAVSTLAPGKDMGLYTAVNYIGG